MDCIFCKIVNKEIPANIIYEDEICIVFEDISKVSPVHALLIPKKHISSMNDISNDDINIIGHLISVVPKVAKELNVNESGYRLVSNCGIHGKQTVMHLHFHLLGGRDLAWPAG